MYCPQKITYIIERGDNLYQIALYFKTTVRDILNLNPNIDPYNLQIGSKIVICPDQNFNNPEGFNSLNNNYSNGFNSFGGNSFNSSYNNMSSNGADTSAKKQMQLANAMRLAWEQHVYWTRMFLISAAQRLKDEVETEKRLLQNPADIAAVFGRYYPPAVAQTISTLITEHLQIGGNLIKALRDGKTAEADRLNRLWYANADKMAEAFSSINPNYNRGDVREMLYSHLGLTSHEVSMRLMGNYAEDIIAFNNIEQEALMMADYFAEGIMRQFPREFY